MPKINTDDRPDDLFHGTDPNKGGKKRSAKRRNNDSEYLNGALIRRDWPSNEPDQLFVPLFGEVSKFARFPIKLFEFFVLQHLRVPPSSFSTLSFLSIPCFIS